MLEHTPSIVGEALRSVRPGLEKTVAVRHFADRPETIAVESTAFGHGQPLPAEFTDDGAGLSPPLAWRNLPAGTAAIALIIEDADSPTPEPLVHAIAVDFAGTEASLPPGALDQAGGPRLGKNSFLKTAYLPPDPPRGHGPHRYVVQVFGLDAPVAFPADLGRDAFVEHARGHVLAKGLLIGTYERR